MRIHFFILLFFTFNLYAQKKITSIKISDPINYGTVDRVGELYVTTLGGQIQKFDTSGNLLSLYKMGPAPTLFEPRDGARLFAYFRKERRIDYLNPSFEVTASYSIDSAFVIDPWLVCSSGDHNLWIIDAADGTLKKIDPRASVVEIDIQLPEHLSKDVSTIAFFREYQGFVFLLDQQRGIYIFNGMGKWIKTISLPNLGYFNFVGEELYYPSQGKLIHLNLFSGESREMPLNKDFKFALLTDERLYLIQEKTIDFFEFRP